MTQSALSAAAWSVWGKSGDFEGTSWMPLAQHLLDSADVAEHVWDWLPRHVRDLVGDALPDEARDGRRLLSWLAGVHDIGKCSPPFAAKVPALEDRMREHGLVVPRVRQEFGKAPHGLVGHAVLRSWLMEEFGSSYRVATSYAVIVGGHHGAPPTDEKLELLESHPGFVGTGRWREVQAELLAVMTAHVGAETLLPVWATSPLPPHVQAVLTGAVIVCDWIASNPERFPFSDPDRPVRAARAWRELGLPPPWHPAEVIGTADDLMVARFPSLAGYPLRPVQRLAVSAAQETTAPSLLIVEAAMGSGKTEAALLAAEILAARFGCGGIYIALPTMATSDAMFGRVLDWIKHLEGDGSTSTFLAHGKSGLNDRYRELLNQRHTHPVYDDDSAGRVAQARVEAEVLAWLSGRKKGVLANMVVGTIDQLLFTALQAKHVALRHLAFAGKVVVVDEAHASDDYMRSYLARTLEWLAAYGVPVVLMSATLPRGQRQELVNAYRQGQGGLPVALPTEAPYPAVTRVTRDSVTQLGADDDSADQRRRIEVHCVCDDLEALGDLLARQLVGGGCAGVIRNTVSRAQGAAQYLTDRLPDVEVVLLHSRFVATHRAQREAELRARLGRDASNRPTALVVVGTQVLEQSLDLDFDVMVTDLAPVDLVLQRTGRLHRHARDEHARPPELRTPRLFITGIAGWDGDRPDFSASSEAVYDRSLLLRAAAVLSLTPSGGPALTQPEDIRPLVESAYADQVEAPPSWADALADADRRRRLRVGEQRQRADTYRLPSSGASPDLVGWLDYGDASEAEDPRTTGASRVRDSEDGIEVVVVHRRSDGDVVHLEDGSPFSGRLAVPLVGGSPDDDVARAVAASTVRLPLSITRREADFDAVLNALERDAHEGWQQSKWLAGQLALHLDDRGSCVLAGWRLTYDKHLGLTHARVEP